MRRLFLPKAHACSICTPMASHLQKAHGQSAPATTYGRGTARPLPALPCPVKAKCLSNLVQAHCMPNPSLPLWNPQRPPAPSALLVHFLLDALALSIAVVRHCAVWAEAAACVPVTVHVHAPPEGIRAPLLLQCHQAVFYPTDKALRRNWRNTPGAGVRGRINHNDARHGVAKAHVKSQESQ